MGHNSNILLAGLNGDKNLDANTILNNYIHEDDEYQHFFATQINADYHDFESLASKFSNNPKSLLLSVNIQSLPSKFEELKSLVAQLDSRKISVDAIMMQETWQIKYPELFLLPGFQPVIFKNRNNKRGGGVGIYVRKGIHFKLRPDLENFCQMTFENITIELQYPGKSYLISNIYHSPNPPKNVSSVSHSSSFLDLLDNHLNELCNATKESFVFLDANIDLLKLNTHELPKEYLNTVISNGFVQLAGKATRVQGNHFSLIDHIFKYYWLKAS